MVTLPQTMPVDVVARRQRVAGGAADVGVRRPRNAEAAEGGVQRSACARAAEPRDDVKGLVARVTFYMFDRYALNMSRQQQQLLMVWDRQHPVTAWERQRDRRIAAVMGHANPFVSGERHWTLGYQPVGDGVVSPVPAPRSAPSTPAKADGPAPANQGSIMGNRNSHVYHLAVGCPSYAQVAPKNQVRFASEAEAQAAGFTKAGNCSP